ncbi:MAG: hypothetical protein LC775_13360 [Acidobacteria bacterium]|nr:hypothetical protein [Acidobacteriota bacterium]
MGDCGVAVVPDRGNDLHGGTAVAAIAAAVSARAARRQRNIIYAPLVT